MHTFFFQTLFKYKKKHNTASIHKIYKNTYIKLVAGIHIVSLIIYQCI